MTLITSQLKSNIREAQELLNNEAFWVKAQGLTEENGWQYDAEEDLYRHDSGSTFRSWIPECDSDIGVNTLTLPCGTVKEYGVCLDRGLLGTASFETALLDAIRGDK